MQALAVQARIAGNIHAGSSVWGKQGTAVSCAFQDKGSLLEPVCCARGQQHEPLDALEQHTNILSGCD